MGNIVVAGSLAFDTLFLHDGEINPLQTAFNVQSQTVFFGGCAGNIMYGALLSTTIRPLPFVMIGVAGHDFDPYEKWLNEKGIETQFVSRTHTYGTAHAYVMTDALGKQLTFFYEGAGLHPEVLRDQFTQNLNLVLTDADLMHIAANSFWIMQTCITAAKEKAVPYFFDPGQALALYTKFDLIHALTYATGAFFNELEFAQAQSILGMSPTDLFATENALQFIVVTRGEKGSTIYLRDGTSIDEPAYPAEFVDPTGCGDAYRGGFLSVLHETALKEETPLLKLLRDKNKTRTLLEHAGRIGTKLASRCLAVTGTQRYSL